MIWLLEHGISNVPSSWKEWVNDGIQYVHLNTPDKAQGLFYFTTPFTVFMRERERMQSFSEMLTGYARAGQKIGGIAHSNGTRVMVNGAAAARWPAMEVMHLMCGACDSDFERLGLNYALKTGSLRQVVVYVAGRDMAMRAENWLGRWQFQLPWGAKPLGLNGPTNVNAKFLGNGRVRVVSMGRWLNFGHSDCWLPANFTQTMREMVGPQTT